MAGLYPIRAVARMTGLSVDTLRAWERRYEAVVPERGERGRVYTDRHVERLKQLAALVAGGHSIGSIASLSDGSLRKLRSAETPEAPSSPLAAPAIGLDPLMRAMKDYDFPAIEAHLNRSALMLPPAELIFSVVLPVMREVGARWEAGAITPAHEHLASGIVRGVLGGLLRIMPRRSDAARLVFATPPGERHELGLLCGAVLAAAAGYSVIYLGPDLPAADIAKAAEHADAKAIVLAATASGVEYSGMTRLKRWTERSAIWAGGARAADLRRAIGPRVRHVPSLEELRGLLDRHVA